MKKQKMNTNDIKTELLDKFIDMIEVRPEYYLLFGLAILSFTHVALT